MNLHINSFLKIKKIKKKPKWAQHSFLIDQTQTPKPRKQTTIVQLDFYLTFYSLDHFLQPKDKNTQHKLKISHLIVYNFSSLIIIFILSVWHSHSPWSHGTGIQFNMSNLTGKSEPHASTSPNKSVTILFYSQDRPGGRGFTNKILFSKYNGCIFFDSTGKVNMAAIQMLFQALYTLNSP